MAARELTQTLGAVLIDSPNASGAGGCLDEYDLLCGEDRSDKPVRDVCPKKHENRLDCGHDDYFNTNPKPGSYLATNWNVATSEFLLRGDGGDDIPDVPGAVEPSPTASSAPTTAPTQAPTPTTPPSASVSYDPGATDGGRRPARGSRRRATPRPRPRRRPPSRPATGSGRSRPRSCRPRRSRRCSRSATPPAARCT